MRIKLHAACGWDLMLGFMLSWKYSTVTKLVQEIKMEKVDFPNFVTKAPDICAGDHSKILMELKLKLVRTWLWKYPFLIFLKGDYSIGAILLSGCLLNHYQHRLIDGYQNWSTLVKNTKSRSYPKELCRKSLKKFLTEASSVWSVQQMHETSLNVDSLQWRDPLWAHTFPYIDISNSSAKVEHEPNYIQKSGEDQISIANKRGFATEGRKLAWL